MSLRRQLQQLAVRLGTRPAEGGASAGHGGQGLLDASRLASRPNFA